MTHQATLAGGCFWCLEAVFRPLKGVYEVVSGYCGGGREEADYRTVCSGMTGHAEAIRVRFEPGVISYRDLLEIFFAFHDPTTLNRQGPDTGTQYRSAIFYHDDAQRETARAVIEELKQAGTFGAPIVTELVPAPEFFPAEAGHQRYYERNPDQAYCQAMIAPKVAKLRTRYAARLAGA